MSDLFDVVMTLRAQRHRWLTRRIKRWERGDYWIEEALGQTHKGWFWLAEDDYGDLLVPGWRTFRTRHDGAVWKTRFNPWKLWHWLPYWRSRVVGNVVMIERYP